MKLIGTIQPTERVSELLLVSYVDSMRWKAAFDVDE